MIFYIFYIFCLVVVVIVFIEVKKCEKLVVVWCYGEDRLFCGVLMFVVFRWKVMFYKKLF